MDPMRHYLAIDGGNSKTDVVIGAENGDVLAFVRGPGTCHQNIGVPDTVARLEALVVRARAASGLSADVPLARADVFLACADLPAELTLLAEEVGSRGWAHELTLDNDAMALLAAGTDVPDAIAVVCGAGINCVGRNSRGGSVRFPALGMHSGDWGGGHHLGLVALWHAVRCEDGRGPETSLARAIAVHYGVSRAEELGVQIHLGVVDRTRLAELAPILFTEAENGDRVAVSVVARQAEEIITMAAAAARRLGLTEEPFTVVLGGGVLRARHPMLIGPVVDGIRSLAPKASLTVVDAPPVLGAALSSLDALAAGNAARAALRAILPTITPR
jgi:N-acetylglucosamine kinase-like BadF-type ATPase